MQLLDLEQQTWFHKKILSVNYLLITQCDVRTTYRTPIIVQNVLQMQAQKKKNPLKQEVWRWTVCKHAQWDLCKTKQHT